MLDRRYQSQLSFTFAGRLLVAFASLMIGVSSASAQFAGDANVQDFAGKVGIGISFPTVPAGKLEIVNATGTAGSYLRVKGSTTDNAHYPDIVLQGGDGVGFAMTAYPALKLSNAGYAIALWGGYSTGVPSPVAAVVDSGSGSFYVASGTTGANIPFRVWSAGSVGVGTSALPSATLDVRGASQSSGSARRNVVAIDSSPYAQGVGGGIAFGGNIGTDGSGNPVTSLDLANIWGIKENATANDNAGALLLATRANGANPTERMRVGSDGLVTIGLSGGTGTRLTVNGDINVTGNINAKYQDIAEWVEAVQPIAAGTVVVLDPEVANRVTSSSQAYSTAVAGVVSDQPGLLLGEAGATKVKVATTGRVKVRVDATRRPAAIGDLLVSGDKPGVAMVSEPLDLGGVKIHRPGTLIGKALEPLADGEGEILVLLSLQ